MCPALSSVAQTSSSLQMSKWMLAMGTQDPGAGWSSSVPVQLSNTLAQTCRRCLTLYRCCYHSYTSFDKGTSKQRTTML